MNLEREKERERERERERKRETRRKKYFYYIENTLLKKLHYLSRKEY